MITDVSEATSTGTTATVTVTTAAPTGYQLGETVAISGVTPAAYDGSVTVTSVTDSFFLHTFTYTAAAGLGTATLTNASVIAVNPLEILVAQIATADGGTNGVFMNDAGPVSITASIERAGSGTLSFNAVSITIQDLGPTPVSLAPGRSLVLKTETGPIVFLNQANTIETSGGGTITIEAGTTAGSGAVAVLGNLTTDGGAITVTADGNITIGLLNAGTGNVTVQSANGIILDGNGSSRLVNVIVRRRRR